MTKYHITNIFWIQEKQRDITANKNGHILEIEKGSVLTKIHM